MFTHKTAICIAVLLSATTFHASAALPPKYLGVKDFKQCLATQPIDTYRVWCMPKQKPEACPATSWNELKALDGRDRIINCSADTTAPTPVKK